MLVNKASPRCIHKWDWLFHYLHVLECHRSIYHGCPSLLVSSCHIFSFLFTFIFSLPSYMYSLLSPPPSSSLLHPHSFPPSLPLPSCPPLPFPPFPSPPSLHSISPFSPPLFLPSPPFPPFFPPLFSLPPLPSPTFPSLPSSLPPLASPVFLPSLSFLPTPSIFLLPSLPFPSPLPPARR